MSKLFLLFFLTVFLLSGCSFDKEKVINGMIPDEGEHSLYVFSKFKSAQEKDKLSKDLLEFVNAEQTQKKLDIRKTQFINVEDENAKDYIKALNIKELPSFVLLNKEGIVLQTNDINQVLNYVHETKKKISIEEAKKLIVATQNFSHLSNMEFELIEITPSDIWDHTKCQLFKIVAGSNLETFIVTNQEAIQIGNGLGGFGVTSAVPYDVNKDGAMDIVYAYSFGSGMHRSIISWIDLKSYTEYPVRNMSERTKFRTYDLILKVESNEIAVYRIAGVDESKTNVDSLRTYPTDKDIDYMTLENDGTLVWKNNELSESAVNEFSIYLVKDLSTTEAMSKKLDDLPLETIPVLTDKEIRTYNWTEHEFTMKEGISLEEKLEGKVPGIGKPFVVVVDNQRIYLGSFWSYLSSQFNPDIPKISSGWLKGSDNDMYKIEYGKNPDPRDDTKIFEALKGLGKVITEKDS
jgi:hypothetical protein